MIQNARMAKKRTPQVDNRKPARMVRIREALALQVDKLVEQDASDFTEVVNLAVRELLAKRGLWPVPPKA